MARSFYQIWNRWFPTFGNLAYASFLVAVISGIPLAIPYRVERAFDSLQILMLTNPGGVFFRSIHYWSGQLFIAFTLVHVIEHLLNRNERDLKKGLWLRLVFALLLALFVMLSGFILKADGEGVMARQILKGLLGTLPLIGENLGRFVLGSSKSLQLIYLHHLVTTTLFIWIIIIEHVRRIWPDLLSSVYLLGAGTILALLFPPGLQLFDAPLIRGPWYFIGLQELLHWIPDPLIVIGLLILYLLLFGLVRWMSPVKAGLTKRILVLFLVFYIVLTLNNWGFRDGNWNQLFL
ncbi:MAG: DUF4405 domain-containing protein [Proteobacteria bacterium]|nr:DUF4405 domain-containing protein [Pseudomonadota bacterium]